MEMVSFMVLVALIVGLIRRLTGDRERTRRRGPGTPARFLYFTGRRLAISKRSHAYSPKE
jgi:hypothetical protein